MSKRHVGPHKYRKHIYKRTGNAIFFCALPDCHHKIDAELAVGKKSICNLCGTEFTMNEYQVRLKKPHCERCSKRKIAGADGKKHYVRQDSLPIMAALANESANDLRTRLDGVLGKDSDDDI